MQSLAPPCHLECIFFGIHPPKLEALHECLFEAEAAGFSDLIMTTLTFPATNMEVKFTTSFVEEKHLARGLFSTSMMISGSAVNPFKRPGQHDVRMEVLKTGGEWQACLQLLEQILARDISADVVLRPGGRFHTAKRSEEHRAQSLEGKYFDVFDRLVAHADRHRQAN